MNWIWANISGNAGSVCPAPGRRRNCRVRVCEALGMLLSGGYADLRLKFGRQNKPGYRKAAQRFGYGGI